MIWHNEKSGHSNLGKQITVPVLGEAFSLVIQPAINRAAKPDTVPFGAMLATHLPPLHDLLDR